MLVVAAPQIVSLPETKYQGELILGHIVAPELTVLHKGHDILLGVLFIFHFCVQDTQIHFIFRKDA